MIERVLGAEANLIEDLTSLIDKSLVRRQGDEDEERVAMLETVREYASERFEHDEQAAALRARHARAYLELAEQGARAVKGSEQVRWAAWLVDDLGNLRAAMDTLLATGAAEEALQLATAHRPLFMSRSHYAEGRWLLSLALDAAGEVRGGVRAAALLALGALAWREGDLAAALPALEESRATYRDVHDPAGELAALRLLGVHAHNLGDHDVAQARLEEALATMRRLNDDEGIANTLLGLGNVAFNRHETRARELYEESLAIAERIGDESGVAYALDNLSVLAWCRGELGASSRYTEQAAARYERLEHPFGIASVLHRRGLLACARHDLEGADALLAQSPKVCDDIGESRGAAFVRYDLARVALMADRSADALDHRREGLALAERHGAPLVLVLYLEGTAALLASEGDPTAAAELLSAADAWRRSARVPICRVNAAAHDRLVATLRRDLGDAWPEAAAVGDGRTVAEAATRVRTLLEALAARSAPTAR